MVVSRHSINRLPQDMEGDPIEMLVLRNRMLIEKADLTRASSEDARTRSGIAKRNAGAFREDAYGYNMGGLPRDAPAH